MRDSLLSINFFLKNGVKCLFLTQSLGVHERRRNKAADSLGVRVTPEPKTGKQNSWQKAPDGLRV